MLKAVTTNLYTDQVFNSIKEIIIRGDYQPGQRIGEVELAKHLGVSRSPIREAIQRLGQEGLVTLIPHKGAFVTSLSLNEIGDLIDVREALEVKAVILASERANEKDLKGVSDSLNAARNALINNRHTQYPWNLDFHLQIAKCSKNKKLQQKVYEINAQLLLIRFKSGSEKGRARQAYAEHSEILKALQKGDAAKAKALMKRHIRTFYENIEKLYIS